MKLRVSRSQAAFWAVIGAAAALVVWRYGSNVERIATWLVPFLAVLLLLVLIHELGHFVTAKLAGVNVQEFGFGYPPRIVGIRFKGTLYSLNLLPLGGFVKLLGEEDPSERRSFAAQPVPVRLMILGAGSFMNAVLPMVLLTATLMMPHQTLEGPVRIGEVMSGSPAEAAGLRAGDIIESINGREVRLPRDVQYNIQLNLGSEIEIAVNRDGEHTTVRALPRWDPPMRTLPSGERVREGPTGISILMRPEEVREVTESRPFPQAVGEGVRSTFDILTLFKNGLYVAIISNNQEAGPAVTGPIGIAQATGEVAEGGTRPLLEWAAFLSMNLAILNILPIPALDGGRIVFVLLEWVRRGRRVPPEREGLVHMVGMAVLLAFIVVVSIGDIQRITGGGTLLP